MVGHRLVQAAVERGLTATHDVVVLGEGTRAAYDRVALTFYFGADGAEALSLLPGASTTTPRSPRALLPPPSTGSRAP